MKKRILAMGLCLLLAGRAYAAETPAIGLTLPGDMVQATAEDAAEAAGLLGTDEAELRTALEENGDALLCVSAEGTLWQVNLEESSISGLDFDSLGQKKAAIFAQQLARSSGQSASVVKLSAAQDTPHATTAPDEHRSRLWICLSPGGTDYPRTDTWITAIRGWQVTVTCTWPSASGEAARSSQLTQTLYGLTLSLPQE